MHFFREKKRILLAVLLVAVIGFVIVAPALVHAGEPPASQAGKEQAAQGKGTSGEWVADLLSSILQEGVLKLLGPALVAIVQMIVVIAQYNDFVNSAAVINGWVIVRDVANMFFVVVLLVIAFGTMLGSEEYHYKKLLPKMLVLAVLVNFSRTIVGVMVDFAQVIMLTFVNGFKAAAGGNFANIFAITELLKFKKENCGPSGSVSSWDIFGATLLAFIMTLVSIITATVILGVLVFRVIVIWMLTILSPFAFLLGTIPQGQKYYAQWWEEFKNQTVAGPMLAFFLWLALVSVGTGDAANQITQNGQSLLVPADQVTFACSAVGSTDKMFSYIIGTFMLLIGVQMAQDMGGTVSSVAGKFKGYAQNGLKGLAGAGIIGAGLLDRQQARLTGIQFAKVPGRVQHALEERKKRREAQNQQTGYRRADWMQKQAGRIPVVGRMLGGAFAAAMAPDKFVEKFATPGVLARFKRGVMGAGFYEEATKDKGDEETKEAEAIDKEVKGEQGKMQTRQVLIDLIPKWRDLKDIPLADRTEDQKKEFNLANFKMAQAKGFPGVQGKTEEEFLADDQLLDRTAQFVIGEDDINQDGRTRLMTENGAALSRVRRRDQVMDAVSDRNTLKAIPPADMSEGQKNRLGVVNFAIAQQLGLKSVEGKTEAEFFADKPLREATDKFVSEQEQKEQGGINGRLTRENEADDLGIDNRRQVLSRLPQWQALSAIPLASRTDAQKNELNIANFKMAQAMGFKDVQGKTEAEFLADTSLQDTTSEWVGKRGEVQATPEDRLEAENGTVSVENAERQKKSAGHRVRAAGHYRDFKAGEVEYDWERRSMQLQAESEARKKIDPDATGKQLHGLMLGAAAEGKKDEVVLYAKEVARKGDITDLLTSEGITDHGVAGLYKYEEVLQSRYDQDPLAARDATMRMSEYARENGQHQFGSAYKVDPITGHAQRHAGPTDSDPSTASQKAAKVESERMKNTSMDEILKKLKDTALTSTGADGRTKLSDFAAAFVGRMGKESPDRLAQTFSRNAQSPEVLRILKSQLRTLKQLKDKGLMPEGVFDTIKDKTDSMSGGIAVSPTEKTGEIIEAMKNIEQARNNNPGGTRSTP